MARPRAKVKRALLKVGDVAKALGTTTRTLVFYEQEALLSPRRTPKGTRLYSVHDVKRFEIALRLSALGIPIKQIKELAMTRERCSTGSQSSQSIVPLLENLRSKIQHKVDQLLTIERDIERADVLVRQCFGCKRKPTHTGCPTCPVEQNLDQSNLARLIWDPRID